MDVKLIIPSAKAGTKEIPLKRPRIIGRARGIGIVVPHPAISERHCLLFEHNGLLMVQDLNSEHGTFVGGKKIVQAPLPPGAELTVGTLTLRAEYSFAGDLNALPKTIFVDAEPAAEVSDSSNGNFLAVQPHLETTTSHSAAETANGKQSESPPRHIEQAPIETALAPAVAATTPATTPASAAPAEFPSFFGLGNEVSLPVVVQRTTQPETVQEPLASQPTQQIQETLHTPAPSMHHPAELHATQPLAKNPATDTKKVVKKQAERPLPPLPPPLPPVVQEPRSGLAPGQNFGAPNFGSFNESAETNGGEPFADLPEPEPFIPGLKLDANPLEPLPMQPEPPVKKKSGGSLLDFFSKRPPKKKRILRQSPITGNPTTQPLSPPTAPSKLPTAPAKLAPPAKRNAWSEEISNPTPISSPESPFVSNPPPPDSVDEDLSNFFKKLE